MKDIHVISNEAGILDHISTLWQTEMFRTAARSENSPLHKILQEFTKVPRIFCKLTEPDVEDRRTTAWMGALALHDEGWHENPYIADLFLFREICRMAYAVYDMNGSFEVWRDKQEKEDAVANVLSEVMIYFWLPDLRIRTFDHPIWADRFLTRNGFTRYQQHPEGLLKEVTDLRLCYMDESHKGHKDLDVQRIAQQSLDLKEWTNIWKEPPEKPLFRRVEFQMYLLTHASKRNRDTALLDYLTWLKQNMHMHDNVPFRTQAEAYANYLQETYNR